MTTKASRGAGLLDIPQPLRFLVQRGALSEARARAAMEHAGKAGMSATQAAVALGHVTERDVELAGRALQRGSRGAESGVFSVVDEAIQGARHVHSSGVKKNA